MTRSGAGTPVITKTADDPTGIEALRHEADVLERLAGVAGVPAVHGFHLDDDTNAARLEIEHVGTGDLSTRGPLTPPQIVELGARVATTLATVHERGLAHGRLCAAHVLPSATGHASVVGFGGAIEASAHTTADDVGALGALLLAELERSPRPAARPGDRFRRGARAAEGDDGVRMRLGAVLAVTTHRELTRRPTMAMLAETLQHEADILPRRRPARSTAGRTRRPATAPTLPVSGRLLATGAVVAGLAAAATITLAGGVPTGGAVPEPTAPAGSERAAGSPTSVTPTDEVDASDTTARADPADDAPTAPTATSTSAPTLTTAAPPSTTGSTVGGASAANEASTNRIAYGGHTYELGQAGDVAAVVDPACDGEERAVLLRPATGELFVFDGWAARDADRPGRLVTRLPSALALARPAARPCGALDVVLADGSTVTLAGEELR